MQKRGLVDAGPDAVFKADVLKVLFGNVVVIQPLSVFAMPTTPDEDTFIQQV